MDRAGEGPLGRMVSLETLSRAELQVLAKQHGIKANLKNADLIQHLSEILGNSQKEESTLVEQVVEEPAPSAAATTEKAVGDKKRSKKAAVAEAEDVKKPEQTKQDVDAQQSYGEENETMTSESLSKLGRQELLAMAKARGIKGNLKTEKLIEQLAESFKQDKDSTSEESNHDAHDMESKVKGKRSKKPETSAVATEEDAPTSTLSSKAEAKATRGKKAATSEAPAEPAVEEAVEAEAPKSKVGKAGKARKSVMPTEPVAVVQVVAEPAEAEPEAPTAKTSKATKGRKSVMPKKAPTEGVEEMTVPETQAPETAETSETHEASEVSEPPATGRKSAAASATLETPSARRRSEAGHRAKALDAGGVQVDGSATPAKPASAASCTSPRQECKSAGKSRRASNVRGSVVEAPEYEGETAATKKTPGSSSSRDAGDARRVSNKPTAAQEASDATATAASTERRASSKRGSMCARVEEPEAAAAIITAQNTLTNRRASSKRDVAEDRQTSTQDASKTSTSSTTKVPSRHSLALAHAGKKRKRGHAVREEDAAPQPKKVRTGRSGKSLGGRASLGLLRAKLLEKTDAEGGCVDECEEEHVANKDSHDTDKDTVTTLPVAANNARRSSHGAKSAVSAGAGAAKSAKKKSLAPSRKSGAAGVALTSEERHVEDATAESDRGATIDRRAQVHLACLMLRVCLSSLGSVL